jgi:hypothetical protein
MKQSMCDFTLCTYPKRLICVCVRRWKAEMQHTIHSLQLKSQQLQAALSKVLHVLDLPELESFVVTENQAQQDLVCFEKSSFGAMSN